MCQITAPLLCSVLVVSLAAILEHEPLGLHTDQDARRTVLADYDADYNTGCCPRIGSITETAFPTAGDGFIVVVRTDKNHSPSDLSFRIADEFRSPQAPEAISPTVLRL